MSKASVNNKLVRAQNIARMTTKHTAMQILEYAKALTTFKLSRLPWHNTSSWNCKWWRKMNHVLLIYPDPRHGLGIWRDLGSRESAQWMLQMTILQRGSTWKTNYRKSMYMEVQGLWRASKEHIRRVWSFCKKQHVSLDTQIWRYWLQTKQVAYLSNHGVPTVLLVILPKFLHNIWWL